MAPNLLFYTFHCIPNVETPLLHHEISHVCLLSESLVSKHGSGQTSPQFRKFSETIWKFAIENSHHLLDQSVSWLSALSSAFSYSQPTTPWFLVDSMRCWPRLWLPLAITLDLVSRESNANHSIWGMVLCCDRYRKNK